jgi:purine-nucleoside phosphorylase
MGQIFNPSATARRLRQLSRLKPTLGIVLGSGFQSAMDGLQIDAEVSYRKLPGFPTAGVGGHSGKLVFGHLGGTPVLALCGRAHYYEGHPMERVTFPVRALAEFGVRDLLLTNAAGGINRNFRAGDFMMLTDHINFMGVNPLRGPPWPRRQRFVDLTRVYDTDLNALLQKAARQGKIQLRSGVYLAVAGPSYETPAEIRAFARLGADAVGMSTVPEAIVARQCGLRVAAVSCIANQAAGRNRKELSHADVLEHLGRVKNLAANLLQNFARLYGRQK